MKHYKTIESDSNKTNVFCMYYYHIIKNTLFIWCLNLQLKCSQTLAARVA